MAGNEVRWKKIANDDAVRLVVGKPRRIPRRRREEIAAILAQELVGSRQIVDVRKHAARHGAFHILLKALKEIPEWDRLREISLKSDILAILALRYIAGTTFDILDRTFELPIETVAQQSYAGLTELTLSSWRRKADDDLLVKGVDEVTASDVRGEVPDMLSRAYHEGLSRAVEELEVYQEMIARMKEMLPQGGEEESIERVLLEYLSRVNQFSELMRRSKELQRIIDLMGKLDVEYGGASKETRSFTTSEAYDIGPSKDVQHLVPVELIKLKVPILRTLFLSQMLEGQLLTYRLRGLDWTQEPEPERRGPVIALIDASGSMSGEPELIAKAFILMLARRMEREGRDIKVILFASEDWKLELNLADKKKAAKSLLDTVCRHFEGNTDFNSALRTGLEVLSKKEYRGADVLFFTDGESKVTDQNLVDEWKALRRRTGSRILTLIVGSDQAGGLEDLSDKTWILPTSTWDVEGSPS
ncbi:MAG TPA: VWA domain-containing protein, partial [Methanomassiliicoccaceae archaeon]|nr:VWA domain-containing protein [Methanomassiliicoccaceae archaeon]